MSLSLYSNRLVSQKNWLDSLHGIFSLLWWAKILAHHCTCLSVLITQAACHSLTITSRHWINAIIFWVHWGEWGIPTNQPPLPSKISYILYCILVWTHILHSVCWSRHFVDIYYWNNKHISIVNIINIII